MSIKKNRQLATSYCFLILGFLILASGSITLGTKVFLIMTGAQTRAWIVGKFPKEYSILQIVDRHPRQVLEFYFTVQYEDSEGTTHTVDLYVSESMFRKYELGSAFDIIYNPKFPHYSIKFANAMSPRTLAVDISLTLTGIALMIWGWYISRHRTFSQ